MFRLLLFISFFSCFEVLACRVPYEGPIGIIEFEYRETIGTYTVQVPSSIGEGRLISVGLSYRKQGSTKYAPHEFSSAIKGQIFYDYWMGTFSARSKEGYDAWIEASWSTDICPTLSTKKVKLFPADL